MELSKFIHENIDRLKEKGIRVNKYKHLRILRYNYGEDFGGKEIWERYLRGVVIDETNTIRCLPPIKAKEISLEEYRERYANKKLYPLIDGTMINVFYSGKWEISTRSEIGGYNKWSDKKSFRKMFDECLEHEEWNLDDLREDMCYSFVMRHKGNRNVAPIRENELYLVCMYRMDTLEMIESFPEIFRVVEGIEGVNVNNELFKIYEFKGYTFYEGGVRYKIKNNMFEEIRDLKGKYNNVSLNYIELRKNGGLDKYLKYFPENKKEIENTRDKIHEMTNELFMIYKNIYIYKKGGVRDIPYYLKPHVNEIHKKYLEKREPTKWVDIKEYINNLESKKLQYAINYID